MGQDKPNRDNSRGDKGPLSLRFTGNEKWASFGYFDLNKYPANLHRAAESCGDRFSLIIYYSEILKPQLDIDAAKFVAQLNSQVSQRDLKLDQFSECSATYHSITHIAALHGMLTSLKAFLDSLAFLWGRLVDSNCSVHTFKRKTTNGNNLSGGVLINWLRHSKSETDGVSKPLADHLEEHSAEWITQAVGYRDDLLHGHGINQLTDIQVTIETTEHEFTSADVLLPRMPDGMTVAEYCQGLATNVEQLVKDGMAILAPMLKDERA